MLLTKGYVSGSVNFPLLELVYSLFTFQGRTPLHLAAAHGHRRVVKAILRADTTDTVARVKDSQGKSPLDVAQQGGRRSVSAVMDRAVNKSYRVPISQVYRNRHIRKRKDRHHLKDITRADLETSRLPRHPLEDCSL